jgi:hypothetical protein
VGRHKDSERFLLQEKIGSEKEPYQMSAMLKELEKETL